MTSKASKEILSEIANFPEGNGELLRQIGDGGIEYVVSSGTAHGGNLIKHRIIGSEEVTTLEARGVKFVKQD